MGDRSTYMAKADKGLGWHPLIAHSADVAAVLERLLHDDSHIAKRVRRLAPNVEWPALRALLVYLAFIHDIGKVNAKFQSGLLDVLAGGPRRPLGHVKIVLDTLRLAEHSPIGAEINAVFSELIAPMSQDDDRAAQLFLAFLAHHGRPYSLDSDEPSPALDLAKLWRHPIDAGRRVPLNEIRRIGKLGLEKSGLGQFEQPVSLPEGPAITHLLAGLITLADWIGSTYSAFPFDKAADANFDTYWETAKRRADVACRSIGVVASRRVVAPPSGLVYNTLFPQVFAEGSGNQPTKLQRRMASLPGRAGGELRLIEASTGSGKTEAALAHFAQLRASGEVGGLMFALPTRATAKAMRDRIEALVRELYVGDVPAVTLAVGGEAPISAAAEQLAERPVFVDGDSDLDGELIDWATDYHKKFLAGEIVVGTIDQALLAVLAVKHAHLRLAALGRHLLVVDEVHSHDTYMTRLLKELLEFHLGAGGHALLMSATLSSAARSTLVGVEPPGLQEALDVPYPTLSVAEDGCGWNNLEVGQDGEARAVAWGLSSAASAIEQAIAAAEAGARVCFIRNTVGSAQETVAQLAAHSAHLLWAPAGSQHKPAYHSRFSPPDREFLDAAVTYAFGKGSTGGGSILVATQVIEQSLDVDFDLVISDLAPVELLLQRIGRLHRHRARDGARPPSYAEPRFVVVGPDAPFAPDRKPPSGSGWGFVYRNLIALELTRRLVAIKPVIHLPLDYRPLLEAVYDPSTVEEFARSEGWTEILSEVEGTAAAHEYQAGDSMLSFHRYYSSNADKFGSEERVRTRLGDDSVEVRLEPPARCWYAQGRTASSVTIPMREVRGAGVDDMSDLVAQGAISAEGFSEYRLGKMHMTYGPSGWKRSRD